MANTNPPASQLPFIRIKIKEAEEEMEYLSRCYSALENALDPKGKKEFQRVLKKMQRVNQELADLWTEEERATPMTEEEITADMEKAHSEGRSYFPFADERLGKQFQANNLGNRLNGFVEALNSVKSDSSIAEGPKKETIRQIESEIRRLEGLLTKLDEEGIKPNPDSPH